VGSIPVLSPSRRVRRTPFSPGVEAAGVKGYTVYNHTLLPTLFRSVEEDYRHLKSAVQVWDVSCERQVRLKGPQARALLDVLTPRNIKVLSPSRCVYVPFADRHGRILNDPVALEIGDDEYWASIADSDLALWVAGVAAAAGFDCEVDEPDVAPLAIQGPLSDDLAARVFGDEVRGLRHFGCGRFAFQGTQLLVARSGYSKQGGFEIYVEGDDIAMPLWSALFEAGADLDVRAGCPNLIERVEGGLLSYGNDMTRENTPLECGLGRFMNRSALEGCYGGRAIAAEMVAGPARMIRALAIDGSVPGCDRAWPIWSGDRRVGQVTSAAWSPDFGTTVAIAMIDRDHWDAGSELDVETPDGTRRGTVRDSFWI